MEVKFIGQGYNMAIGTTVASELILSLQNQDFTSFKCLVAFASFGGVSAMTEYINIAKTHVTDFKIIIGIDHQGTSKEALDELLSWGVDVSVYHSISKNIFHPKIYIFKGPEKALVIVGSNNFTEMGLSKNVESSILLEFSLAEDNNLLTQIESYFAGLLNGTDSNLKSLSQGLIDDLHRSGKLPSETEREKKHDVKYTRAGSSNNFINDLFTASPIAQNPDGFRPRRIRRTPISRSNSIASEGVEITEDNENWLGNENSPVLVAQIGGGSRWKQVNFPIQMFQNFFGAIAGNNQYHINLRHITSTGDIGEIEDRQAVTVASQNYRFELGAATGNYPVNNRPIGVFVRVAPRNFLYHLILPSDVGFNLIHTYLVNNYNGPAKNLSRIQTTIGELLEECPNLPF